MSEQPRAVTRFALSAGARIAYDVVAPAHCDTTVVFVHDLLRERSTFGRVRELLPGNVRSIAVDCRGHGASATLMNQRCTIRELAADLRAILETEQVETARVVGHGVGGTIAVELARAYPGAVVSLVLIEPALPSLLDHALDPSVTRLRDTWRTGDRSAADAAYKGLTDISLDRYATPRWGTGWREAMLRPALAAIRRNAGALIGILPAMDSYDLSPEDLTALTIPVTIVIGPDAAPIDAAAAEMASMLLQACSVTSIPLGSRSGILLPDEAAAAVAGLVTGTL